MGSEERCVVRLKTPEKLKSPAKVSTGGAWVAEYSGKDAEWEGEEEEGGE